MILVDRINGKTPVPKIFSVQEGYCTPCAMHVDGRFRLLRLDAVHVLVDYPKEQVQLLRGNTAVHISVVRCHVTT